MSEILFCKPDCEFLKESEQKNNKPFSHRLQKKEKLHFCLKCGRLIHGAYYPRIIAHDNCPIKDELKNMNNAEVG